MLRNAPPAQRRLVLLSGAAVLLSIAFVVFAVLFAARQETTREREYRPFRVADAARLAESVATVQPVFFPDPTGGTRGFVIVVDDGDLAALHVVPPGNGPECPVDWAVEEEHLEDCRGRVWEHHELRRFPSTIDDEGLFVVDPRRTLPPSG